MSTFFSTVKQWKTDNNLSKSFSLKPIRNSYYPRNTGQGLRVEYFIISSDISVINRGITNLRTRLTLPIILEITVHKKPQLSINQWIVAGDLCIIFTQHISTFFPLLNNEKLTTICQKVFHSNPSEILSNTAVSVMGLELKVLLSL